MTLSSSSGSLPLVIAVSEPELTTAETILPVNLNIAPYDPVEINIRDAFISVLSREIAQKTNEYVDKDRFLKTLLNFGNDTQRIIINWKADPDDSSKLLIKLLEPLDFAFDIGNSLFISREVANSVSDTISLELLPQPDISLWLRPKNTNIGKIFGNAAQLNTQINSISGQTLSTFGINLTGSATDTGGYSYSSSILNQWYTNDYRSAELNLDFTDYSKFVTYGSAQLRLAAFKEKLRKLENLVTTFDVASIPTASIYLQETSRKNALEKDNIIRSFDPYERYLYYVTGSAYSASAYYLPNNTEYNPTGSWPRDGSNNLWHTTSSVATSWYETQTAISNRYDQNNANLLSNALPSYLIDDINSVDFIKFTQMIGHFFDSIKPYIDELPRIYDRNVTATTGLSQDLVWDVAKSFGINLSNPNPSASLSGFTLEGERETTTEIYKRFLHNAPYINRTRGTITSLKALLRIFGINEQVIGIRETNTTTTGSFELFDEVTNALNFNTGSFITLPMSSSLREVKTLQFRFINPIKRTTTLGVGDALPTSASWAIRLQTSSFNDSPYGRIELINSTGNIILSSSYWDMFDAENYNDVMLRYDGSSLNLQVAQSDGEEILYSSSMSTTTGSLVGAWPNTQNFYLGGSGSLSTNNFTGLIDEVRVWGEEISDNVFKAQVLDPGSFVGNDYTSAVENLWIRLSFHSPRNVGATGNLINESPYKNKDGVSDPSSPLLGNLITIPAFGFENITSYPYNMDRVTRKIRQYTTNAGAYSYGSNQILIAPPPVFVERATDGGLILHKDKSIVNNNTRKSQQQTKNYLGFFVSPTDAVNNLIIRSLGNIDIKSYLGYDVYSDRYTALNKIQEYYKQWYNKSINIGEFTRFFDNLAPTLFEQASQLVPAKTTLMTGVVIEPNILEHKKVVLSKPINISGANTRRNEKATGTEKTYNRDMDITLSAETTVTGSRPSWTQEAYITDYSASFVMLSNVEPSANQNLTFNTNTIELVDAYSSGSYDTYNSNGVYITASIPEDQLYTGLFDGVSIETSNNETVGNYLYYTGNSTETIRSSSVIGQFDLFDSDIDKISYIQYLRTYAGYTLEQAKNAAVTYKPKNIIDIFGNVGFPSGNLIQEIKPRADFDDAGVTTYFIKENAIYFFETVRKDIIGRNQLNILTGSAATWSFGQTYQKNDVVVQLGATTGSAKYYNGKLFRYIDPAAEDQSGSVSYQYPSLDKNRWVPVFYRGVSIQTPYRYIFDTFRSENIDDPNILPLTQVTLNTPIVQPDRYSTDLEFDTVNPNEIKSGFVRLKGSVSTLFSVNVIAGINPTSSIRIRLYDGAASRAADVTRPYGIEPTGSHGVLTDIIVTSDSLNTNLGLFPPPVLVNNESIQPPIPHVHYTIEELAGNNYPSGFIIRFNYFAIEAPIQLPVGYLPRHYKFYRDTLLATKRRNYIGCLQTQDTTTDGRSPVEVTFTAGTTLTVSPNILQNEENLGGINLNVN